LQNKQVSLPETSWCCPLPHCLQASSFVIPTFWEYFPAEQALQRIALDTPVADEYRPWVQFLHDSIDV
jgi:hypothetical protein